MSEKKVILKKDRETPFRFRHPWVFSGAIQKVEGGPADGGEVDLFSDRGEFIARGLYNGKSQIRVRLYSWHKEEALDKGFFQSRILSAVALRKKILKPAGFRSACRLVFSEGDGLSGLTVDKYGSWVSLQYTALGMAQRGEWIIECLVNAVKPRGITLRTEKGMTALEGITVKDGPVYGKCPEDPITISEHGLKYKVDLRQGQKTGFYLDQRDNRAAVADYARGRHCLDVCCYSGGFALNMAGGKAKSVTAIDVSEPALALAGQNAKLNKLSNIEFIRGDAFRTMAAMREAGKKYGLIVLDPPRFAHSTTGMRQALTGYVRLNGLALSLLEPGGMLVTCSCSGRVTREMFMQALSEACLTAGRTVRILRAAGQAADHVINPACPESAYLKCFFCYVV